MFLFQEDGLQKNLVQKRRVENALSQWKKGFQTLGFTLLELLVTLAISSILALIAIPAVEEWVDNSRSKATRQQLMAFISIARSHALERSQVVTICHLGGSGACEKNFDFPISLFVDTDRNAIRGADEPLIKTLDIALPENKSVQWNRSGYLRFWPSGGTGALTGSLSHCDDYDDEHEFRLVIARTGRTRVDIEETRCD